MTDAVRATEDEGVRPDWRPALARPVILRHDRVRGVDLLVLPERVVVLRGSAGSIVELCDGEREVAEIVRELERRHPGASVADDVLRFLADLRGQGWLR
ncbi:pyrroloquinoline quinone biosynthesis peptide chaperone PqqD [Streptomyces durmitorensis]|uniref:Pyrroloquinoline quinone biosynthesis peptide chaperone PqqD n=1 Tax=Streptomyces durmitorensis TaxID=319947 RepID=A0ABY4PQF9_9ACTN|nr:pyrroloquinoline quinone biosynthesis peptide chaperone PqqD [Streptomyces durmitorensis]UQT55183.1 pyrroloquinoline quinone biosynthesis peptide chaperone PqqD [Streptomyces durmitorensis]